MTTDHRIPIAAVLLATALATGAATVGAGTPPPPRAAEVGAPTADPQLRPEPGRFGRATTTTSTSTIVAAPAPTVPPAAPPPTTTPPPDARPPAPPPAPPRPAGAAPAPPPARAATPPPPPPPPPPSTPPAPTPTTTAPAAPAAGSRDHGCEADLARWANGARADAGVAALAVDGAIAAIPVDWSAHMADRQTLAHNPGHHDQIRRARPEAGSTAENVGYASDGGRGVFDRFMASAGHRSNILRADHTHVATGCRRDASGTTWVTMNFWG